MNQYKNNYGFHSPIQSEEFANLLIANGIEFEDVTWHNDELDRFEIKSYKNPAFDMYVWIGDPENLPEYHDNTIWLSHKFERGNCDLDVCDLLSGSFEVIIAKIKELTAN